jgi:branched-chain amino acid transport system substrate-binding protein
MSKFKALLAAGVLAAAAGTADAQEIRIAVGAPLTGQYAAFGEQLRNGAVMAVKELNEAGGLLGQRIVLEEGDDACDPRQAVAIANQFAASGVVFVAGHYCSGSSIPASQVYNEEGILQITPASTNPTFTEQGFPLVFRVCGRDDQQGEVAAAFIKESFPDAKIAILHDKSAYGKGLADATKENLNGLGIQEALYEAYTAGERDYSALVSKLKQNNIDFVYIGGYHTEAGLIVRQMHEQGMDNARVMSGDAMVTQEFWSITGEDGTGMLMTFSPDPKLNPTAAPAVEMFRAAGIEPEGYVLYTYGAVQAWAEAVRRAGTTDPEAVAAELHKGSFDTVLGNISFNEKGDVSAPGYVVYEWKDGTYAYYNQKS